MFSLESSITFAASTAVAALASHYFARRLWYKNHSLTKLEELYDAFQRFDVHWRNRILNDKIAENSPERNTRSRKENMDSDDARIMVKLVNLYFHRLKEPLSVVAGMTYKLIKLRIEDNTRDGHELKKMRLGDQYKRESDKFLDAMFEEAERIRRPIGFRATSRGLRRLRRLVREQTEQC